MPIALSGLLISYHKHHPTIENCNIQPEGIWKAGKNFFTGYESEGYDLIHCLPPRGDQLGEKSKDG